ncbi:MAG: N-acetylglucosamine-6-phosphate deacetylase [Bacteroidota bacterium]|nr:N-acetylglucosamine-6-phosphate deacetylase [Bacteroidota bacterium]
METRTEATTKIHTSRLFTGTGWLANQVVEISGGRISDIRSFSDAGGEKIFPLVAPAFMDIQIYGAFDKLLAVYPEPASLELLHTYCLGGGAAFFQPTVATNSTQVFYKCIDAVKAYWEKGGEGCLGLHIEGPWLHPQRKGAHIERFIHAPEIEEVRELLAYGKGVITMITLAPEVCKREVVDMIQAAGIVVSAGHSNASYHEGMEAFNAGISAATHLYNAMSPLQHRAPGLVGAIFDHPGVMASMVPDGYHVDVAAMRIAKKIMQDRLFVITDAVTETSDGPYPHHFSGDRYVSNGILSGSALNMIKALRNLVEHVGIDLGEALRMVSLYPARVMKLDHRLGKIEKGLEANMVMLDADLKVQCVLSKEQMYTP